MRGRPRCGPRGRYRIRDHGTVISAGLPRRPVLRSPCSVPAPLAPPCRASRAAPPATAATAASLVPDPDDGGIKLPEGFRAVVVADDLGAAALPGRRPQRRRLREDRAGRHHRPARHQRRRPRRREGDRSAAGGGTGIALHDGWLYHSSNSAVYRYQLAPGRARAQGQAGDRRLRPSRRAAAQRQVLRLRRRRPALRRGRLALQRLRRARTAPSGPRARTRRSS